jgi:hypothetical protein
MPGPVLTIAEKQLTFGSDGSVTDSTGASQGTWTTQQDNKVHYTIGGEDQTPLDATWSMDANNVLSVVLSAGAGTEPSASFAFLGGVEIDDATHLIYFIVDGTGTKTGFKITLTGAITLSADSSSLSVALAGAAAIQITGDSTTQILTAAQNSVADFNAEDLLNFAAVTTNTVEGVPDGVPVLAKINFAGNWDIRGSGLVFVSQVRVPAGGPATIDIAFAGTLKGVTVGFEYFTGADATDPAQFAFNISGQHVFDSGKLNWSSSIGFTGKAFTASVEITDQQNIGNNKLSITGKLNLSDTAGGPLKIDLSLSAEYDIDKNGVLKFTADVEEGGPTPSYDLMLSGTYKYSNMSLTFSIDYTDKAGVPDLRVNVAIQGDQNSVIQKLSLILDITPAAAQLQLTLSFSARLQFVDGQRVTQPPVQAAAAQGAQPAVQAAPGQQGGPQ